MSIHPDSTRSTDMASDRYSCSLVYVTPEMAERWLSYNTANRNVSPAQVSMWAEDMAAGRWRVTGEGIKFATTGRLLDGQHRLMAIVHSGVTVALPVFRGIAEEAQDNMDSQRVRTAGHMLTMHGNPNGETLASAARVGLSVDKGRAIGRSGLSKAMVQAWIEGHPDIRDSVAAVTRYARRANCPASMVAYSHWRFTALDAPAATLFWHDASEQAGLPVGDPVLALVRKFNDAAKTQEKLTPDNRLALIFRAWNLRREGRPMKSLRLRGPHGNLLPTPEPR